jgi:hypothetical protein
MLYKVLGMIVWRIGKRVARRKAGGSPAPLLAGALVAVLVAVAFVLRGRGGE